MKRAIIAKKAPAALGPYVHAVDTGGLIFTSGQLGLDPITGNLVDGVVFQTHQALRNLHAVLDASGSSLDHVVKTMVFLDNMDDFAAMNGVYGEYFQASLPARSCVEVGRLPKGALVEIEAIAVRK